MEPKALFDKALSEVNETHTFSSDREIVNKIRERAKYMKTEDKKVRVGKLTEIEVPHYEKRKHTAAGAAAGAVIAASAIAGTVFGLNTYGGLKENGVTTGAGYHGDTAMPAQSEPEVTDDVIPAEDLSESAETEGTAGTLVCAPSMIDEKYFAETDISYYMSDNVRAHISGYTYDGLVLMAKYELTYPEEITNYPSLMPTLIDRREVTGEVPFRQHVGRHSRFTAINGNTAEIERCLTNLYADNSFDTLFVDVSGDPEEARLIAKAAAESGEYDVPIHRTVPDIPVIVRELSEEMPEYMLPDGSVIYPDKLYISACGIFIDFTQIDLPSWEHLVPNMQPSAITLTMTDGSEITIKSENQVGHHGDDGIDYVGGLFDEMIDTRNIASVNILGQEFVSFADSNDTDEEAEEAELSDYSSSAYSPEMYAGLSESLDSIVGKKTEYDGMYATLKSYVPCGRFVRLDFEVEYKDPDSVEMPIMNLGEISWYPVEGTPFDSKIYCANYDLEPTGNGMADFSLTLYNELAYGEKIDTVLQCLHFDSEDTQNGGIVWEKGADITVYGFGTEDSEMPAYESRPGTVIASSEVGDATLDNMVISGAGIRLDISFPGSEEYDLNTYLLRDNLFADVRVVLRYKDGTEYETELAGCNYYSDNVNNRGMFYLFDKNNTGFEPLDIVSVTFRSTDNTPVKVY